MQNQSNGLHTHKIAIITSDPVQNSQRHSQGEHIRSQHLQAIKNIIDGPVLAIGDVEPRVFGVHS
jgi:hypothetical protein